MAEQGGKVRCYYELLEVARSASDDELKKSYRRLALRWHPDKNPDRVDEATAHFRLVQKAYECLSDAQERAWYDKHRERILKGGLGRGDAYTEERLDVFQFFTSSCYDDYDDGPEGYYTVYAKLFKDLADEEVRASADGPGDGGIEEEGEDGLSMGYPEFGKSDSDYSEVVRPFYAFWEAFNTRKSYVWVEELDIREAPNKFVRKAMEKENKAKRDAARRQRNEEVRTLVAFVKKRDPRVKAERRRLEARAKEVEAKAKAKAREARAANMAQLGEYSAPQWANNADMEAELRRIELEHGAYSDSGDSADADEADEADEAQALTGERAANENGVQDAEAYDDEELIDEELFCPVCEKLFRTIGAKNSHDRSKRHRERLERLRAELQQHDTAADDAEPEAASSSAASSSDAEGEQANCSTKGKSKKQKKKLKQMKKQQQEKDPEPDMEPAGEDKDSKPPAKSGKKQQRRRRRRQDGDEEDEVAEAKETGADAVANSKQQQEQVCSTCGNEFASKNQLFKHLKESGHAAAKRVTPAAASTATSNAASAGSRKGGKRR